MASPLIKDGGMARFVRFLAEIAPGIGQTSRLY